jgi:hypothetical protein
LLIKGLNCAYLAPYAGSPALSKVADLKLMTKKRKFYCVNDASEMDESVKRPVQESFLNIQKQKREFQSLFRTIRAKFDLPSPLI